MEVLVASYTGLPVELQLVLHERTTHQRGCRRGAMNPDPQFHTVRAVHGQRLQHDGLPLVEHRIVAARTCSQRCKGRTECRRRSCRDNMSRAST